MSFYQDVVFLFKKYMGKRVDFDGKYNNQCVDFVKRFASDIKKPITTSGDAHSYIINGLGENWEVVNDPAPGDIIVFPKSAYMPYGHIAVVHVKIGGKICVVEQNRDGRAFLGNNIKNFGSPVSNGSYNLTGKEVFFRKK